MLGLQFAWLHVSHVWWKSRCMHACFAVPSMRMPCMGHDLSACPERSVGMLVQIRRFAFLVSQNKLQYACILASCGEEPR